MALHKYAYYYISIIINRRIIAYLTSISMIVIYLEILL